MSPQTETKASVGFKAGVKDYKLTYYTPDYETKDTDILAAFRVTPQPGVPPEEAGAAVAAESSTGTWTTVWTDGLTSLDRYKGRCYHIEPVAGEESQFIAYVAYPLDLFEEGSVTNMFTSIVGNVFGFKWFCSRSNAAGLARFFPMSDRRATLPFQFSASQTSASSFWALFCLLRLFFI